MRYQVRLAMAAITVMFATANSVPAHAAPSRFLVRGDTMAPPTGFVAMCQTDGTFCQAQQDAASPADAAPSGTIPAWRGRIATGLPAVTMAVANMIAVALPDILGGLSHPSAPGMAVTTHLGLPRALRSAAPSALLTTAPTEPGFGRKLRLTLPDRIVPLCDVGVSGCDQAAGTGALPGTAIRAAAITLFDPRDAQPPELPELIVERSAPVATIAVTAPARPKPSPDAEARLLQSVNKLVNGRVVQRSDMQIYATDEKWQRSGIGSQAQGDCEDLAIEKRYQLVAQGYDPARLSFAVVFSPQTGLHTVLVARTDDGDMVLDSATPWVRRVDQTSYSWVSIQSPENGMRWQSVRT